MALDFSTDYQYIDGRETVVVTRTHNPAYTDLATITTAIRVGTYRAEGAPSGGVYTKFITGWQFKPAASYPSPQLPNELTGDPKLADTITDSSNNIYTITAVGRPDCKAFWAVESVKLDIESALDDTAVWYRQSSTTNVYADRIMSAIPYQPSIACRIQPTFAGMIDVLGKRSAVRAFKIYINTTLEPQYGDYFTCEGKTYKVLGWNNNKRIDELLAIDAEIQP